MKLPVISIAGILGKKNGEERKGKREVTVHSGDTIATGVAIGLAVSVTVIIVLLLVYLFFGSLGSDKSSPELTDPVPILIMISLAAAFIFGVILVFMFTSSGTSIKPEKKSKLAKAPKLKITQ